MWERKMGALIHSFFFVTSKKITPGARDKYLIAPGLSLHYANRTFVMGGLRRD